MMARPTLPLEERAEIERARDEVFQSVPSKFDLLFPPVVDMTPFSAPFGPKVPRQRKPANMVMQLQQYSSALFDAEAQHYPKQTSDNQELCSWLEDLALTIEREVTEVSSAASLNFHCPESERSNAITDGIKSRIDWWIKVHADLRAVRVMHIKPPTSPTPYREFMSRYNANLIAEMRGRNKVLAAKLGGQPGVLTNAAVAPPSASRRLANVITSPIAARKLEAFLETSVVEKTVFAGRVGVTPRTILSFRRTGKITRSTLQKIAKEMGVTPEELISPE